MASQATAEVNARIGHGQTLLSVVAASRNDGHGVHARARTQVFVDGLADQARRFGQKVELVLVDWNPPRDAPPLKDVLTRPAADGFHTRVITVPPEIHLRFARGDSLRFFQMIAKNVGIRRARGDAILATNIDIVLSDKLFLDSIATLKQRCLYRADRADIPFDPEVSLDPEVIRASEPIRVNRKDGIYYPGRGKVYAHVRGANDLAKVFIQDPAEFVRRATRWSARSGRPSIARYRRALHEILVLPQLHFNACGDFTLLTREGWEELRGYPEWEMYSWNLDSLLLYQAAAAGFDFAEFDGHEALHLEHSGGWSPESHADLFAWLERERIPFLSDASLLDVALLIWRRRRTAGWRTNLETWGMRDLDLAESTLPTRAAIPTV